MKKALLVTAIIVLIGGAFWAGTLVGSPSSPQVDAFAQGRGAMGGPLADLTDEERQAFQEMTDEERQAFLENRGIDAGQATGGGSAGGPMRGGIIQGEVIEIAEETITVALDFGGSQTVYLDADTVTAYAEGAGQLTTGSNVLLFSEPEADGVTTAIALVVR